MSNNEINHYKFVTYKMRLTIKCTPCILISLSVLILLFIRGAWRKNNNERFIRDKNKVEKNISSVHGFFVVVPNKLFKRFKVNRIIE